jgi:hypothetical protein
LHCVQVRLVLPAGNITGMPHLRHLVRGASLTGLACAASATSICSCKLHNYCMQNVRYDECAQMYRTMKQRKLHHELLVDNPTVAFPKSSA